MKVDIILISYNQEQFISQAIESILMQRVKEDVEMRVIVADDFSNDRTLSIIRQYDEKQYESLKNLNLSREKILDLRLALEFIYLESISNLGISKNYQRAFAMCDADYVAILEGDDYWSSPNHIEQHVRFLDNHRGCSMSMNAITRCRHEKNEFIASTWHYPEDVYYVDTKTQIAGGNHLGNLSACVLRNSCIQLLPKSLYDMVIADWMLGIMLSQQGLIALLKESTSVYRTNSNSVWASLTWHQQIQQMLESADIYNEYQNKVFDVYWKIFKNNLVHQPKTTFKEYLPPVLYSVLKALIPPFVKFIKRKSEF